MQVASDFRDLPGEVQGVVPGISISLPVATVVVQERQRRIPGAGLRELVDDDRGICKGAMPGVITGARRHVGREHLLSRAAELNGAHVHAAVYPPGGRIPREARKPEPCRGAAFHVLQRRPDASISGDHAGDGSRSIRSRLVAGRNRRISRSPPIMERRRIPMPSSGLVKQEMPEQAKQKVRKDVYRRAGGRCECTMKGC